MIILYQMPYVKSMNAERTIYHGYKHAFEDLGHTFATVTAEDNFAETIDRVCPDIFMTALDPLNMKLIDNGTLIKHKQRGMRVFVKTPAWQSPFSRLRVNETKSLKNSKKLIELIMNDNYGDVYYNVFEQGDPRMEGFTDETGYSYVTIPLAADKYILKGILKKKFKADLTYIGTFLPGKREFFRENVFPLRNKYQIKMYGQDWTFSDRTMGWAQKFGQYFKIPVLKDIRKPRLALEEEGYIYASSSISINVHEEYQRQLGGDCNERTFKIPLCNGFELTDDVSCIHKYFNVGKEMVVCSNKADWLEKIDHYMRHSDERLPIIEAGRRRVLADHTYHNRTQQIINIFQNL